MKIIKFILKCLSPKLIFEIIPKIYALYWREYDYRLRLTHDPAYFTSKNSHHWNQPSDVRRGWQNE